MANSLHPLPCVPAFCGLAHPNCFLLPVTGSHLPCQGSCLVPRCSPWRGGPEAARRAGGHQVVFPEGRVRVVGLNPLCVSACDLWKVPRPT